MAISVSKHIKDLLFTHECVIVPELGGFVTNYKPATVSSDGKFITPPTSQIGFNKKLNINDGLLINDIMHKHNISYAKAKQVVYNFVETAFLKLDNGESFYIKDVGNLKFDKEYNLIFSPENKTNFNIDAFGFDAVSVPGFDELLEAKKNNTKNILLSQKAKIIYLSLPIVIMLSVLGVNKIKKNNVNFTSFSGVVTEKLSDTVSFLEKKLDSITKKEYALYYSEDKNKDLKTILRKEEINESKIKTDKEEIKVNNDKKLSLKVEEPKDVKKIEKTPDKTLVKEKNKKHFYLIAGSFKTQKRANKQVKRLKRKGLNPEILKSGNKYRISIAAFENKDLAKKSALSIKKKYRVSTWVLSK